MSRHQQNTRPETPPAVSYPARARASRGFPRFLGGGVIAGAALLSLAGLLDAHDFWIVPDAFAIASGDLIAARGQSGTRFPASESAVPANRVVEARIIGAATITRIGELTVEGKSLRLRQKPPSDGQYLIALAIEPRTTRAATAGFRRYLELEGAADEAARLEREGAFRAGDSVSYRSAKFAKTIVEVGSIGPRVFDRRTGDPIEFVPLADPNRSAMGDTLHLRVIAGGMPVAGLRVHAGAAADSGLRVRGSGIDPDLHLFTDADGVVHVPLAKSGLWNVRTAHVSRGASASNEWEVHWTTFVFNVLEDRNQTRGQGGRSADAKPLSEPGGRSASDSAEVVSVVRRFHELLAAADSTAALALLSPDVVILESGDVETRDEYRSHHLAADIAYARAPVRTTRTPARVVVRGDVAWVASSSSAQGEMRGRTVNSSGAELMILTRVVSGWQIRAIHWSSRARRTS